MVAEIPGTAAFGKFMRIVQEVADEPGQQTIAKLSSVTGMPRPTVHRTVTALIGEGMLSEDGSGHLQLGPRLISLAFRSWEGSTLRRAAADHLVGLRDRLDETVHLAVHDGPGMVYVDKLESRRTVRMTSRLGTRVALHSTAVGKAWLAALPPEKAKAALFDVDFTRHTPHTIADREGLEREIEETRSRGYSLDLQENELDICGYGRAIEGPGGRVLGCISVSMPTYRFESLPREEVLAATHDCVAAIARATGSPVDR
jgi:DNA-binding IclR family transcriptional regulator